MSEQEEKNIELKVEVGTIEDIDCVCNICTENWIDYTLKINHRFQARGEVVIQICDDCRNQLIEELS